MKIIAINGSPRKNKNTAILLEKALEGAASKGAETEIVHLYDIDFKGCKLFCLQSQKLPKTWYLLVQRQPNPCA